MSQETNNNLVDQSSEEFAKEMSKMKLKDILLRGATPEDIQKRAHQLCSNYLGGAWRKITAEEMALKRISGGFTNQLYYCGLPEGINPEGDEPNEVAFRLYGPKHFGAFDCPQNERFSDTVVTIMMSECQLGPKIYGVLP